MSATFAQAAEHAADLWSAAGSALQSALAAPIVPVPHDGPSPLSPAQERLYFLMQPGNSGHYNVPMAWRVKGRLDVGALERSVHAIAARHENLRTVFVVIEGRPRAVVSQEVRPRLQFTDLRSMPGGDRLREALGLAREQARLPFDLQRGPLLRAALYRLTDENHLFLVTVSQIVFDGWSIRVFSRELALCYRAFAENEASPLKALPVHWLDYVYAQAVVEGGKLEQDRSYWQSRFAAPYRPLDLPYDHRAPAADAPAGIKLRWTLPRTTTERLHEIAQQEGVTHFAAFLAGLQAWLGWLSGQDDVIVFTSTFARRRPETREMVGLFANVLPLRTDLSGEPTLRELMRRVRGVVLDAFAHQTLPFENILEILRPAAGLVRNPLFQVMLIHQNAPLPRFQERGAVFTPDEEIDTGTAKFGLLFTVCETTDGLQGYVTYRADVFEPESMESLLEGFDGFLSRVLGNPDQPLKQRPPVAAAGAVCAPERLFLAPRDELERQLAGVWERLFGRAPMGLRDNFFEMGGHSLLGLRLCTELEKIIGKRLPLATLLVAPTIGELAEAIRRESWTKSSLVPIQPRGSRPPVFCISGVGGSVMLFHDLARHLDCDQPVYGLEPPQLEGMHAPLTRVEEIAAHYIRELRTLQAEGPYFLLGFSFGGLVAFEMAQQLVEEGQKIRLLAMFDADQSAATVPRSGLARVTRKLRIYRYHFKSILFGPRRLAHVKRLASGKAVKLFYRVCGWIGRPVPAGVAAIGTTEDVQVFARANYRPRSYPGRIVLFRARIRPPFEVVDRDLGWGELARGGVEVRDVPGDHHTMSVEPHVRELAASFGVCLEAANRRSSRSA